MECGLSLDGIWEVKVISGPWWFRKLKRNFKLIEDNCGINVWFGQLWGEFKIEKQTDQRSVLKYTELPIVDIVYIIHKNLLYGSFYWKEKFIGQFEMRRIK